VCAGCDRLGNYSRVFGELLCTERHEWGDHGDHARLIQGVGCKYPPAKPGALSFGPLKAA
jgi:hypothetical protein